MYDWLERLYDALPQTFVVHCGHSEVDASGLSGSLAYLRAKLLAHRSNQGEGRVASGLVNKSDVVGPISTKFGAEVRVRDLESLGQMATVSDIVGDREEWLAEILAIAERSYALGKISHHGSWHWEKVEYNAMKICERVKDADCVVARLFAMLHDCRRRNEHTDPEHGARAASFARELFYDLNNLKISDAQFKTLEFALQYHSDGEVSDDPTIGVCWDADRLDLFRVWKIPDPELLSTQAARDLLWRI